MSGKSVTTEIWRIVPLAGVGTAAVLVLLLLAAVHPPGAMSLPLERDPAPDSEPTSGTETHTVYLPSIARCYRDVVPPFGVQFYGSLGANSGFKEIADAGASWVRLPISWKRIEPTNTTPENYDWSSLDAAVAASAEEGVELILTLAGQPSWAAVYEQGPVTDTKDIEEFLGAVVRRYSGDGVDDAPGSPRVTYFELYNEPDNGNPWNAQHGGWGCWGDANNHVTGCGDAEDYAALLQTLYPVVKEANPRAELVFGGLALDWYAPDGPFDSGFLDTVLAACEGCDCFDVMNFHYYPPFRSNWEAYGPSIIGKANYVRQRLENYGRADVPVICTETSWYSDAAWGNDELQSRYVVKAYVRGMAADLDVVTWFWARDGSGGGPGLLDVNRDPKDSYKAFDTTTAMLRGAVYRRPLTSTETGDERIEGYVFQTCAGRLDVVWVEDDTPYDTDDDPSLPLTVSASSLRVVRKFGHETEYRDDGDGVVDGKITVQVSGSPLFLVYNR